MASELTSQVQLDSYAHAGAVVAMDLVNELAIRHGRGQAMPEDRTLHALARALAADPSSVAQLSERDVPGLVELAHRLHEVFDALDGGDTDDAASRLNDLLAKHPAHPHLAKENGSWRLHHHPVDADIVGMWTAICAEGLARVIGAGHGGRLGTCESAGCDRVFVDLSKNASRRFCSTTCQNRVKAAAFRRRRGSVVDTREG